MNEIVKINPADYGLEESKAREIEALFTPMLAKMTELEKEYNDVIALKITPETALKAKELRLKYVKVRTGTAEIHKGAKAFYLAGGRFVDGWKNAQLFASEGIEAKLMDIEKHQENQEKERIQKLHDSRLALLRPYIEDDIMAAAGIGRMDEDVWKNYLLGVKVAFEQRKEAERKAEEDRIAAEKAEAAERERIRLDNIRLQKEAEEREKQISAEREKVRKEQEKREKELAVEREKAEAERKALEEKARKEAEEREKLAAEIKAKEQAVEAERKSKEKADKAAKLAPDKEKLSILAEKLDNLEFPELQSPEADQILSDVISLLNKVTAYIREKSQTL